MDWPTVSLPSLPRGVKVDEDVVVVVEVEGIGKFVADGVFGR